MTTILVFVRHADAEDGFPDKMRPLSDKGRRIQRQMAEVLKKDGLRPKQIFCSPYLRAQQTADILSEVLEAPIEVQPALAADDFDEEFILKRLNPPEEGDIYLLVGHEPTLSQFVQDLADEACLPTGFAKSGTAVLEFPGDIEFAQGVFQYYLPPIK